jgi:NAD(P)H-dependent FMN reductase
MRIIGIAGSLRTGSFNSALLRAAVEECPRETALEIESIRGIPLYDGDVEAQGLPTRVLELKEIVAQADGLLSQTAWLQVLRTLGTRPYFGASLYVGNATKVFDAAGKLVDDVIRERLRRYMHGFVEFVKVQKPT